MQANTKHAPDQRMPRRQWLAPALAGTLALATVWVDGPARAEKAASEPVLDDAAPSAAAPPAAPEQVRDAINALAQACAAWPQPMPNGGTLPPGLPVSATSQPWVAERELCHVVADPEGSVSQVLWVGGAAGAAALAVGLVGVRFLRALLLGLWRRRPSLAARLR